MTREEIEQILNEHIKADIFNYSVEGIPEAAAAIAEAIEQERNKPITIIHEWLSTSKAILPMLADNTIAKTNSETRIWVLENLLKEIDASLPGDLKGDFEKE